MKPLFFLLISLLVISGRKTVFAQKPHPEAPALIQKVLEQALTSGNKIPDFNLLNLKKKIVVSRAVVNVFHADIPMFHYDLYPKEIFPEKIGDLEILALSKPEIQIRADKKKRDYLYLQLGQIKVEGNRAEIGISTQWAVSKKTKSNVYMSGGGYVLEFIKEKGQWKYTGERMRWQG